METGVDADAEACMHAVIKKKDLLIYFSWVYFFLHFFNICIIQNLEKWIVLSPKVVNWKAIECVPHLKQDMYHMNQIGKHGKVGRLLMGVQ